MMLDLKWWRWMPGMRGFLDGAPFRVIEGATDGYALLEVWFEEKDFRELVPLIAEASNLTPDLRDPATIGCIMSLVRESRRGVVLISHGQGWWSVEDDDVTFDHDNTTTFEEALLKALETAS